MLDVPAGSPAAAAGVKGTERSECEADLNCSDCVRTIISVHRDSM